MSLTLSVPFLMDVLSRVAKTPVDSNAPPFQNQNTLLDPMEIGQSKTLTLSVTGLSPTTLTVAHLERDGADLTAEVSHLSWTLDGTDLRLGDQITYDIAVSRDGDAPSVVSATATFSEAVTQASWVLGSAAAGSFDILASAANGLPPTLYDAGDGALQIGDALV